MGQYFKAVLLNSEKVGENCGGLKLMEHSWLKNDFVSSVMQELENNPDRVVWLGNYADDKNLDDKSDFYTTINNKEYKNINFIYNNTKKQYIDLTQCIDIHPLPLLTCEGNGRGGGDFHYDNPYVGYWSRDEIFTSNSFINGYKEIIPNFVESEKGNNMVLPDLKETTDKIVLSVIEDLKQRSFVGIKKYGVTLDKSNLNLKSWLQHAYEECLDQANYLKRAIQELK